MDGIFDRLGNLIRSIIQDDDPSDSAGRARYADPDMEAAWDELDDYLGEGKTADEGSESRRSSTGGAAAGGNRQAHAPSGFPEELRQDYGNLELPVGASFDAVRKAYKNLLIEYHPDKHSGNSEKQRMANEITKKINESFQRIKRYHEKGIV